MYFKHLKRLMKPKQYPFFRTVKLRYIFLHILIIAILFSIPNSIHYYNAINVANQMVENKQHEIPDFKIKDNVLVLKEEQIIDVPPYKILFSNKKQSPENHVMSFQKYGIQVDESTFLSYLNLPMFHDKTTFITFLKTYTASSYFYLSIIIGFLIFIQFITTVIKIIFISTVAHVISVLFKRKSRFMNWLKITTFLLTLPSIILFLGLLNIKYNAVFIISSWTVLTVLILATVHYLPRKK
ncbi:DUF1189 domain-containing protein [Macrococcoides goetzii]|uniref:DUF1189 domain-containing protein n=1 Tax=Macrococcoides goetzii TaxID=1891097 RepID=A0A2G5NT76_9STAP|nr:DUF1189 family protein [Macrococcus goetzii]RAI82416.1 DUF1189 domain-containing protein [Macrococcus goetzii]